MNHDIKRMLELAAKAAEFEVVGDQHPNDGLNVQIEGQIFVWRPAHDDGDTLRLQVNLGLLVDVDWDSRTATAVVPDRAEMARNIVHIVNIPEGSDGMSETRQAVLMAAAAIGEAMP